MNTAQMMYALSIPQIRQLISVGGGKRTVLIQGHMGTGKSSLLNLLAKDFPTHTPCYFDCTTKDLGDITIPDIARVGDGSGYVTYLTNEELGAHHDKPIILMVDEFGKSNPAVKNALLRLMLERKIGSYTLHPDSLIFATTNLGAEGVGDLLPAHARNRLTVVTMRKPTADEWIGWGIGKGIDPMILGWARENPSVFEGFENVTNPSDNPYIFHPKEQRAAFVTPRSLEAASDWMRDRAAFDDVTMTAALMGTIGERAALDLMAFSKLADQLPTIQSIKDSPMTASVPTSASAVCMVVYKALASIERDWVDAWMTYMGRLDKEAQGMFLNGLRVEGYPVKRLNMMMQSPLMATWARENGYMFAADKK